MANNLDALTTARILYGRELLSQLKMILFLGKTVSRKYSQSGTPLYGVVRVPNVVVPNVIKRVKNSGSAITFGDTSASYVDVTLTEHAIVPMKIDSIDAVISDIDFRVQMAMRAAYKIAAAVEGDLASLYTDVGQYVGDPANEAWSDGTNPSTATAIAANALLDAAFAPSAPRYGALSGGAKQSALSNPSFTQFNTAGVASTLVTGDLGERFGIMWGLAQGVASHTGAGVATQWAGTLLIDQATPPAGYAIGATTIHVDGFTDATPDLKKGDAFKIGSHYYSLAADVTGATNEADLVLAQPLAAAVGDGDAVTIGKGVESGVQNLVFLPEAFAFATAPVDDVRPGTVSQIIVDEQTGLSIRVTYSWDHSLFAHLFTTELLYGFKTVRPELAVRLISKT